MPEHLLQILNDLFTAMPAAFARILLENRKDPQLRFILSVRQKGTLLAGSLFFAAMAGQVARDFDPTKKFAMLIVIAAAFCAQDACTALIKRSRKEIPRWFNPKKSDEKSQPE